MRSIRSIVTGRQAAEAAGQLSAMQFHLPFMSQATFSECLARSLAVTALTSTASCFRNSSHSSLESEVQRINPKKLEGTK